MALIGKPAQVLGGLIFTFTLTIGGSSVTLTNKSASATTTNYKFVNNGKNGWHLEVYASGSITFSKLTHKIDACAVGGGGGGGGGTANAASSSWFAGYGGRGGGGAYADAYAQKLTKGTPYTITIGYRGSGGAGATGSYANAGEGTAGGPSSLGSVVSAAGGAGGTGSYRGSNESDAAGQARRRCFNNSSDTSMPEVCGAATGLRGSGGEHGYGTAGPGQYTNAYPGSPGVVGLVVIRSAR